MIRELRIRDFAIIRDLEVCFQPGLNVLTGETGAGKSIIIDALGIALGERAYSEMIRSGCDSAAVQVYFETKDTPPILEELAIGGGDGIVLRRVISTSSGKSRAFLNDTMVGVQTLSDLGRDLVDIHGQHEHQSLLSSQNQLRMLDEAAGLVTERKLVGAMFAQVQSAKEKLAGIGSGLEEKNRRREFLTFQIEEITSAGPEPGEDAKLEEEKKILSHMLRLRELMESAYSLIYGAENSALEGLSGAKNALEEAASIDPEAGQPLEFIRQALPYLEEAAMFLRSKKDSYEPDPDRLAQVEERLELIKKLRKKYGGSIEEILEFMERAQAELSEIIDEGENSEKLEKELKELEKQLNEASEALSAKRKKFAAGAEMAITLILKELALEKAVFSVEFSRTVPRGDGADKIEFLFNANPGEALKPLGKVASGGELSRLMLALKSAMRSNGVPVLVFDEVDAGIGGKTAWNVAIKLKELARTHQVLCITHEPQIAGAAGAHFVIEKEASEEGTKVIIREVKGGARQEEVARMLGGKLTDASLRHAKELIERGFLL
ncbi:MAG: DNA repair protein RecN [Nitrospiraceae bacterium]|nr:DNA repair protein RecN [Nitrospiraceae bacterium]